MLEVQANLLPINKKDYLGKQPELTQVKNFYDSNVLLKDESGNPLIMYKIVKGIDTSPLAEALLEVKYDSVNRSGGITTNSAVFGYIPRVSLRRNYCSVSGLALKDPYAHKQLLGFIEPFIEEYKAYFPEVYKKHEKEAGETIMPEWRILGTPFTSGIVNYNSAIKYHHDAGNIRNCASNMLLLTRDCEGGDFVVPEYDCAFKNQNNALFIFDGQSIMHGVTRLKILSARSFRLSIVYYTLQQMWNCLTHNEEVDRANEIKTKRLKIKAEKSGVILNG